MLDCVLWRGGEFDTIYGFESELGPLEGSRVYFLERGWKLGWPFATRLPVAGYDPLSSKRGDGNVVEQR
jgi:hypothetical protein